ncbi:MAG: glycosyltransferase [Desulfobacterales bacterium]|nr:glycosyltransferase [Desulfobacterales bacterium]
MKVLCAFGQHNYGDPARGEGYEYTNFLPTLQRLGHEVFFFDIWDKSRFPDFARLNQEFISEVAKVMPDVIFCVLMGYELWTETLDLIHRATGALLVNWATDDSWKFHQFSRFVAPHFDLYATTYRSAVEKAEKTGLDNFMLTQWGANSQLLAAPRTAGQCRYQVSFVGWAYGNRKKWILKLKQRGIQVDCFGYGWTGGPVAAQNIPKIIRDSVISLNFSDSSMAMNGWTAPERQIKARVFEVPACGGFLLTENASGLEECFRPGKEIETFDTVEELAEKINHFLLNPSCRDRIAMAGFQRVQADHLYDARFTALFSKLIRKRVPEVSVQGREINPAAMDPYVRRHKPGRLLKLFAKIFLAPFVLIWGHKRGERAARRALFEMSWRLFGAKTYSARGLPGRLFYRQS